MDELITFLAARLDEAEAAATPGRQALDDLRFSLKAGDDYEQHLSSRIEDALDMQTEAWRARALCEVEAKRAILAGYEDCLARMEDPEYSAMAARVQLDEYENWVLPNMAAAWSDHPGYRQEWAP